MKEELLFTAIDSESHVADSMEALAPKLYEEDIKACDYFIEKTNCVLEKQAQSKIPQLRNYYNG